MNTRLQVQTKTTPTRSFIPVGRNLLPQRSPKQAEPPLVPPILHEALATFQAKLTIGQPNDQYEQEADRVADQVMRMPEPKVQRVCPECEEELQRQPMEDEEEEDTLQTKPLAEQITPLVQRQAEPMEEEEEEETLQTKTTSGQPPTVSSSLQNRITALQGGGQPLPRSECAFFEPRFGADFSQVRVHADSQAAETARVINASAFTIGRDIVFGAEQYQPSASEGRRLLAHELTHVVQQCPEGVVQLKKKKAARKDLIFVLSDEPDLQTEGKTLAPNGKPRIITSVSQMVQVLKEIKFPIKNLVIVAHGDPGYLEFKKGNTTHEIALSKLAAQLKNTIPSQYAPDLIDFRACSIGARPGAMEKIRNALGAKAVIGSNCGVIMQATGPIEIGGQKITKKSQLNKSNRAEFEPKFQKLIDSFGSAKDCILDRSEGAYFRSGGKLVAVWTHPAGEKKWDRRLNKSKCYKALPVKKVAPSSTKKDFSPGLAGHCKLIRVEKTP